MFVLLCLTFGAAPALALDGRDAIRAWGAASPADKERLLNQMAGPDLSASTKILTRACLDDVAGLAAHGDLPIAEVFKACAGQAMGQKV